MYWLTSCDYILTVQSRLNEQLVLVFVPFVADLIGDMKFIVVTLPL